MERQQVVCVIWFKELKVINACFLDEEICKFTLPPQLQVVPPIAEKRYSALATLFFSCTEVCRHLFGTVTFIITVVKVISK